MRQWTCTAEIVMLLTEATSQEKLYLYSASAAQLSMLCQGLLGGAMLNKGVRIYFWTASLLPSA